MARSSAGSGKASAAHSESLREMPLFKNYADVRDWVLRLKSADVPAATQPAYGRAQSASLDCMLDASPLLLQRLRLHGSHLTGHKIDDYRFRRGDRVAAFAAKIAMLESACGGRELFVPEAPELGGFGFEINGALVNIDTLKFWEVMIALEKAAVLEDLRKAPSKDRGMPCRIVWEIGASWGGFARVFKTILPHVSFVIVDFPETMLFSALYLKHVFPQARFHFHEPGGSDPHWTEDFVFFAHADLKAMQPPRLDLALSVASFEEMTRKDMGGYVETAWNLGAPYLYSLNRERSLDNPQLDSVSDVLSRCFWPHEIPVLEIPHTHLPEPDTEHRATKPRDKGRNTREDKVKGEGDEGKPEPGNGYRHIIGWRKIET